MKITVDTSHDTHDDIKKVIRMLQNLVGDSQEIFTNQPQAQETVSPIANIFGDTASTSSISSEPAQTPPSAPEAEPTEQSTEDLFAELFSEEELKKMDTAPIKEEDEEPKQKKKKYDLEFY
ncbi:hypothetical protein HYW20_08110 [Candidatus Woesearchaeota archaeon]|nr:hypothetical protein [Candidatus Woesearchaeota archaeon]